MKTPLSASAILLTLFAGPAQAADFAAHKADLLPPAPALPVADVPLWTGFYAGVNSGGAWSAGSGTHLGSSPGPCGPQFSHCAVNPGFSALSAGLATFDAHASDGGFLGGGQIGYNWQVATSVVTGFETDIQGVASPGGAARIASAAADVNFPANPLFQTASVRRSLDYLGTVRGRVGYLLASTFLVYGVGGLAYGGVSGSVDIAQMAQGVPTPLASSGGLSSARVGWTAGGGAEWMVTPAWSTKVEYLYYDLGAVRQASTPLRDNIGIPCAFPEASTRFNGHAVRAGLNYHFVSADAGMLADSF